MWFRTMERVASEADYPWWTRATKIKWTQIFLLIFVLMIGFRAHHEALGAPIRRAPQGQSNNALRALAADLSFAHGLFRKGRFELAAQEYRKLLLRENLPSEYRVEAIYGFAHALLSLQEHQDARTAFVTFLKEAASDHPNRNIALFRVGELSYLLGDVDAAIEALESFLDQNPSHPYRELAWPYLGDLHYRSGALELARAAYQQSLEEAPDGRLLDRVLLHLGTLLVELGEPDAALQQFRSLVQRPDPAGLDRALDQIGRLEFQDGNIEAAEEAFGRLMTEVPQSDLIPRATLGRADALLSLDRPEDAITIAGPLQQAESAEVAARASYLVGRGELALGRIQDAISTFDRAIGRYPDATIVPVMLFQLAEQAESLGDQESAFRRFEALARGYPDDLWAPDAALRASSLALKLDQFEQARALAQLARTLQSAPESNRIGASKLIEARAALALDQQAEAIELLESIAEDPEIDRATTGAARYYLGIAYQRSGDDQQSTELLQSLASTPEEPFSSDAKYLVGQRLYESGRFEEAIEALEAYLTGASSLDEGSQAEAADHALARIALAHGILGNWVDALNASDRLTTGYPQSTTLVPSRIQLAELAIDQEQWDLGETLSMAVVDELSVESSLRIRSLVNLGWAQLGSGRTDQAIQTFDIFLREAPVDHPDFPEVAFAKGRTLMDLGRSEEALETFRLLQNTKPESEAAAVSRRVVARLLADLGRSDEAINAYQALIDDPDSDGQATSAERLAEFAGVLDAMGRLDEMTAIYQRLIVEEPESPEAHRARLILAEQAAIENQPAEVLRLLQPLIASDSLGSVEIRQAALYRAGRTLVDQDNLDTALETFKRLVEEFPEGLYIREATFWNAEVAYRIGELETALGFFESILDQSVVDQESREPWLGTVRLRRVQCLLELQRWDELLAATDGFIAGSPESPQRAEVEFARGRALQMIPPPRFDQARASFDEVIARRPGSELAARAQFMKGETYFLQQAFEDAVREFLRIDFVYDAPQWESLGILEAGKAYERLEEWSKAVDLYEDLLNSFPDQPASADAESRLGVARERALNP